MTDLWNEIRTDWSNDMKEIGHKMVWSIPTQKEGNAISLIFQVRKLRHKETK